MHREMGIKIYRYHPHPHHYGPHHHPRTKLCPLNADNLIGQDVHPRGGDGVSQRPARREKRRNQKLLLKAFFFFFSLAHNSKICKTGNVRLTSRIPMTSGAKSVLHPSSPTTAFLDVICRGKRRGAGGLKSPLNLSINNTRGGRSPSSPPPPPPPRH